MILSDKTSVVEESLAIKQKEKAPSVEILLLDKVLSFSSFKEADKNLTKLEKNLLQTYLGGKNSKEIDGIIGPRTWKKAKEKAKNEEERLNSIPWREELKQLWKKIKIDQVLSLSREKIALLQRDLNQQESLAIDGIKGKNTKKAMNKFLETIDSLKTSIDQESSSSKIIESEEKQEKEEKKAEEMRKAEEMKKGEILEDKDGKNNFWKVWNESLNELETELQNHTNPEEKKQGQEKTPAKNKDKLSKKREKRKNI